MKKVLFILVSLLAISSESEAQLLHDIQADSILAPRGKTPIGFPAAFKARLTNAGTSTESNVQVEYIVWDPTGSVVFRDTFYVGTWNSRQTLDLTFNNITPLLNGHYQFCAIAILPGDQNRSNDSTCAQTVVAYSDDAQAIAIQYPKQDDSLPAGVGFQPVASFRNVGVNDIRNGPSKIVIRRCADQMLVAMFQQTNLNIPVDSFASDTFPNQQGSFDTRLLPPGCYQIAAVARIPNDGDHSNDTAYSTFSIYATHDISADSILTFLPQGRIPIAVPNPIRARFTNQGASNETNVMVACTIFQGGQLVYSDTGIVPFWGHGQMLDLPFKDWTPQMNGGFEVCAIALLAGDQDATNDRLCRIFKIAYLNDAEAVEITKPLPINYILYGQPFRPVAVFRNVGVADLYQVPARIEFRRCSDLMLVFRVDTLIDALYADSSLVTMAFPSQQGPYDTKVLPAGCYQVAAIARYQTDGDHTNDTAFSSFTIGAHSNVDGVDNPSRGLSITGMFPNPASTTTTLAYSLLESGDVTLHLIDVTGREILIANNREDAGEHTIPIEIQSLMSGVYLCQLSVVNARWELSRVYCTLVASGTR
ncbi:MAG: T9SS type A sorting domain-containing protein [Bacteroidota bacterium]|nr:T9SS type A sorting domain-containing protein [Bacteroidota bacterium]MDP4234339.1 T9SS type A sorting domain-containing protein [Bacteroidota bacterium]MDP4243273.1 T9SS type A sorting domain-containing protein [Bacteroidota bacterium]MDP4289098.1 T9SS type A sorting domain-containing protein [Bacteroidota bacterium]